MFEDAITSVLQNAIAMSAVTCAVLAFLPLIDKRFSPKGIYYSLVVLLLGFLIPFRPVFQKAFITVSAPVLSLPSEGTALPSQGQPASSIPDAAAVSRPGIFNSPVQIIFLIWIIGIAAVLIYHLLKHFRFMRIIRRWSDRIDDESFLFIFGSEKKALGINKDIGLRVCSLIDTPMLTGFFRPVILLPDTKLCELELRLVLRHELIHYRRRDLWSRLLMLAALAVNWFNPLVYALSKAAAFYCEASCDSEVTKDSDLDARQYYSETIISVIRRRSNLQTALSTSFYGGKNGMKRRIISVMNIKKKSLGLIILSLVLLITLGTGMVFAFGPNDQPAIDLTGKSDSYRLIAEMSKLDDGMSVAEYNLRLNEMCENNGLEFFALLSDVSEELDSDDPLYPYYTGILSHSSSERFADIIGGSETSFSSAFAQRAKYGAAPVREEHYTDAEWAFVQETGPEIIYFVNVNYVLVYDIPDRSSMAVSDREKRISDAKNEMQAYVDGLSEADLGSSDLENRFKQELARISEKYSDGRMSITGELQSADYIGELFGSRNMG